MPADELPRGRPGKVRDRRERNDNGTFRPGNKASRRGGRGKAQTTALASKLGLANKWSEPAFDRYKRAAQNFARLHIRTLRETVGGGHCGPGPASLVQSAALQLAASRYAFEVSGDHALGSRLADASRQNLLAAHELCAREGAARSTTDEDSPLARLLRGDFAAAADDDDDEDDEA